MSPGQQQIAFSNTQLVENIGVCLHSLWVYVDQVLECLEAVASPEGAVIADGKRRKIRSKSSPIASCSSRGDMWYCCMSCNVFLTAATASIEEDGCYEWPRVDELRCERCGVYVWVTPA